MEFASDLVAAGLSELVVKKWFSGKEKQGEEFVTALKAGDKAKAKGLFALGTPTFLTSDDEELMMMDALAFGDPRIHKFFRITNQQVKEGWAWLAKLSKEKKYVLKAMKKANYGNEDPKARREKWAQFYRAADTDKENVLTLSGFINPSLLDGMVIWASADDKTLDTRLQELQRTVGSKPTVAEAFHIKHRNAPPPPPVTGPPATADNRPRGLKLLDIYRLAALSELQMHMKRMKILAAITLPAYIAAILFAAVFGGVATRGIYSAVMSTLTLIAVFGAIAFYGHIFPLSGLAAAAASVIRGGLKDFLDPILPGMQNFATGWSEEKHAAFKAGFLNAMASSLIPLAFIGWVHAGGSDVVRPLTAGLMLAVALQAWATQEKWKTKIQTGVIVILALIVLGSFLVTSLIYAGVDSASGTALMAWVNNLWLWASAQGMLSVAAVIVFTVWIIYIIVNIKTVDFGKQVRSMLAVAGIFMVLWFCYWAVTGIGNFFSQVKTNQTTLRKPGTALPAPTPSGANSIQETVTHNGDSSWTASVPVTEKGVTLKTKTETLTLQKGDLLEVTATGQADIGRGLFGPEGERTGYRDTSLDSPFNDRPAGLEGWIGSKQDNHRFFVGARYSEKVTANGTLTLRIIESIPGYTDGNNGGGFTVTVRITKSASN